MAKQQAAESSARAECTAERRRYWESKGSVVADRQAFRDCLVVDGIPNWQRLEAEEQIQAVGRAIERTQEEPAPAQESEAKAPQEASEPPAPDGAVAVMEMIDTSPEQGSGLSKKTMESLSHQVRIRLGELGMKTIGKTEQDAAVVDLVRQSKRDSYKDCYDEACQIEIGKAIAATHIVRPTVARFGEECVLNVELINLRTELTVWAKSGRRACKAERLLDLIPELLTE